MLSAERILNPVSLYADQKWRGILPAPHFPAKAKRVIWLTMAGGPSHLEIFDYKPKLAAMHGQPMPESITAGQQLAQFQGKPHPATPPTATAPFAISKGAFPRGLTVLL